MQRKCGVVVTWQRTYEKFAHKLVLLGQSYETELNDAVRSPA